EKVVSAAELMLNDYVLKPFTAEMLLERIARAIDKRDALTPIHQMIDHGSLNEAIEACEVGEHTHPRHQADFMRLRAELHMMLGELDEAEALYSELFAKRSIAWARLGLATTLFMQNRLAEAEDMLQTLVDEKRQFLEAYDWLARTQEAMGRMKQAQQTLENAV